jgi:hypothetical protein
VKNFFYNPKSGVLPIDDNPLDRLLAKGAIVGACIVQGLPGYSIPIRL